MAIKVLELLITQIICKVEKTIQRSNIEQGEPKIASSYKMLNSQSEIPKTEVSDRPKMSVLASEYQRLEEIHEKLQQQNHAIFQKEQKMGNLEIELSECKGILKGSKRQELKKGIDKIKKEIEPMKCRLTDIVKEYGYPDVKEFLQKYHTAKAAYDDYKLASENWEKKYGKGQSSMSIHAKLKQYEQDIKTRDSNRSYVQKNDRSAR